MIAITSSAVSQTVAAVVSLLLVVGGGELLTTGTEWASERLGLSQSVTGSVFAALATSLPETLIPVIAILQGRGADIGVGAILGGPITLTTLATFLLGASGVAYAARGARETWLTLDTTQVTFDLRVFLAGFSVAVLATFLRSGLVPIVVGPVLVALYAWYLYRVSRDTDGGGSTDPEALELGERVDRYGGMVPGVDRDRQYGSDPTTSLVAVQVLVAVGLLLAGSHLLVGAIEWASGTLVPVPTTLVALFVAPVVSNLPENVDGVIWIARGEDSLAVEQLTGTLAFQGTVGVAVGVAFTRWELAPAWGTVDFLVALAAAIALASGAVLYAWLALDDGPFSARLFVGFGLFYLLFVGVLGYYLGTGLL